MNQFKNYNYIPILAIASIISMLKLGIFAKFVSAASFGEYSSIMLYSSTFSVFISLGSNIFVQNYLPVLYQEGQSVEAFKLNALSILVTIITSVMSLPIMLLLGSYLNISNFFMFLALLNSLTLQLFMIIESAKRSRHEMVKYSMSIMLRAVLGFGVGFVFVLMEFSVVWAIVGELIVNFILFLVSFIRERLKVLLTVNDLIIIIKKSVPLCVGLILFFLVSNGERWIVSTSQTVEIFGEYSFLMIVVSTALSSQALINAGIFPRVCLLFNRSEREALRYTYKLSLIMLVLGAVASGVLFLPVKELIAVVYPKFTHLSDYLAYVVITSLFKFSDFFSNILILIEDKKIIILSQVLNLLIMLMGYFIFKASILGSLKGIMIYSVTVSVLQYLINITFATFFIRKKSV